MQDTRQKVCSLDAHLCVPGATAVDVGLNLKWVRPRCGAGMAGLSWAAASLCCPGAHHPHGKSCAGCCAALRAPQTCRGKEAEDEEWGSSWEATGRASWRPWAPATWSYVPPPRPSVLCNSLHFLCFSNLCATFPFPITGILAFSLSCTRRKFSVEGASVPARSWRPSRWSTVWAGKADMEQTHLSSSPHLHRGWLLWSCDLSKKEEFIALIILRKTPRHCEPYPQQPVTAVITATAVGWCWFLSAKTSGQALPFVAFREKYKSYQVTTWISLKKNNTIVIPTVRNVFLEIL